MEGDGAPEIKPEQVMAAIGDRTQKMELLATNLAAGPHPIPEEHLARLRNLKAAISAEIHDLTIVLDGVNRGDLAFMEEIPPSRLDWLLAARTDRMPRLRGVPLERRLKMESAALALAVSFEMPTHAFSTREVMAAPHAPSSARGQVTAASQDLARLQI